MKKNNKYARIRTTAELDLAIRNAHQARERAGRTVGQDFSRLHQNLRPSNLVSTALRQVSPYFAWSEIGLGLVRGLKHLLGGRPAGEGRRHREAPTPSLPEQE